MTETESLDVKAMGLKEDENNLGVESAQDSQIEASVGENDVAALVDEAEKLKKVSSEEMDTNENILEPESKPVENVTTDVEASKPKESEPMDIDQHSADAAEIEKVDDSTEGISDENNKDIETNEEKSHIPDDSSNTVNNTNDDKLETSEPTEVVNSEQTDSDNANNLKTSNETIPSTEENVESKPEETEPSKTETETITDTNKVENVESIKVEQESISTQPVIQANETENTETEIPAQISIPEDNEAQDNPDNPSMNDSFSEISASILNSDPSSNVLKSVVDTTINDMITTTTTINTSSEPSVKMPVTSKAPGNGSHGLPMLVKPPKTEFLLQTAKEVLQLRDEPPVLIGKNNLDLDPTTVKL